MANPFTKPTLTGYNPSPAPDTGAAGGSANVVRWAKHTDEIGDPLRDFAQSIADNIEDAFENLFGPNAVSWVFTEATAPPGWTQLTNIHDRVLRLTSGVGNLADGSWTITGLAGPVHTHGSGGLVGVLASGNDIDADQAPAGEFAASGQVNISGNTGNAGGGAVTSDGTWRPRYLDVIRCQRSFA